MRHHLTPAARHAKEVNKNVLPDTAAARAAAGRADSIDRSNLVARTASANRKACGREQTILVIGRRESAK